MLGSASSGLREIAKWKMTSLQIKSDWHSELNTISPFSFRPTSQLLPAYFAARTSSSLPKTYNAIVHELLNQAFSTLRSKRGCATCTPSMWLSIEEIWELRLMQSGTGTTEGTLRSRGLTWSFGMGGCPCFRRGIVSGPFAAVAEAQMQIRTLSLLHCHPSEQNMPSLAVKNRTSLISLVFTVVWLRVARSQKMCLLVEKQRRSFWPCWLVSFLLVPAGLHYASMALTDVRAASRIESAGSWVRLSSQHECMDDLSILFWMGNIV